MGVNTGGVLDYATRNKRCKKYETTEKEGSTPQRHDCRKNYDGSAKSMEPDVAVELFKRAPPTLKYAAMIGDDDYNKTSC